MNYVDVYDSIINYRKNNEPEGYYENHHIVPRCLGGSDDDSNLVKLTLREHFVVHKLLYKIYPEEKGICYAYWMMCNRTNAKARDYAVAKEQFNKINSEKGKLLVGEKNPMYGRNHSSQTRKLISKRLSVMMKGSGNSNAKLTDIYEYGTDKLIAEDVLLKEYCRQNNLQDGHMSATISGRRKHHRGLYAKRKDNLCQN
jgi:hypothetical protein